MASGYELCAYCNGQIRGGMKASRPLPDSERERKLLEGATTLLKKTQSLGKLPPAQPCAWRLPPCPCLSTCVFGLLTLLCAPQTPQKKHMENLGFLIRSRKERRYSRSQLVSNAKDRQRTV